MKLVFLKDQDFSERSAASPNLPELILYCEAQKGVR